MRKRRRHVSLLAAAVGACASLAAAGGDTIKFSHKLHVEDAGVECVNCHGEAKSEWKRTVRLLPGESACAECHEDAVKGECGLCHSSPEKAVALKSGRTIRNYRHGPHLTIVGTCTECHQGILEEKQRGGLDGKKCHSCHDNKSALGSCELCHADLTKLRPVSHHEGWLDREGHGIAARFTSSSCESCHMQSFCDACHQGQLDVRIHEPNYRFTHKMDARNKDSNCSVCHRTASFCTRCH